MKKITFVLILLFFCAFNSFAQQVSSDLRTLLSGEGKVLYGEEPNSIVVMDYPENLERITDYLNVVDVIPQQVLIEARVVEVKLQGENSLGVNWQLFAEKGGLDMGQFKVQSVVANSLSGKGVLDQIIPFKKTLYPPGTAGGEESPFTISIFDENINLVLSALANEYNTDILSAPRVTTVNNRTAEIKIVQSLPWALPTVTTTDGVSSVTWEINFESVGITLQVTPTINENGDITMTLNPEISEKVRDYELTVVSGATTLPYFVPVIDRRTAATKVIIGNGQTLIIGGLIKNKMIKGETKIPFLGDMPMMGHLFKSQKETKEKTELLIFVSPTVINPQEMVRMAKHERFGPGAKFIQDKERQEKIMLVLENKENINRVKRSSDLEALFKKQQALSEQTAQLEQAVLAEEKNVKKLEQDKEAVVARKKKLSSK
jgi:type IV pilus secretin PilQ/predicted competence protein